MKEFNSLESNSSGKEKAVQPIQRNFPTKSAFRKIPNSGHEFGSLFKSVESQKRPTVVQYPSGFNAIVEPAAERDATTVTWKGTRGFVFNPWTLKRDANELFEQIEKQKLPAVVQYPSGFKVTVRPLTSERAREIAKEGIDDLISARAGAEEDLANGNTISAAELATELGIDVDEG